MKKLLDVCLNKYADFKKYTDDDLGFVDIFLRIFLIISFFALSIHNIAIFFNIDRFLINWSDLNINENATLFLEYNPIKSYILSIILIVLYYNFIYSIFRKIDLNNQYNTYTILENYRIIDAYDLKNNKISSNRFDEISIKFNELLDKKLNQDNLYSSTMIYDEEGRIGSKFVDLVKEGHWMTSIYDERNNKFTVEHFRTWENLQNIDWQKRLDEELLLNSEIVFGFKDKEKDYSRNREGHIFTNQKKQ